MDSFGYLSVLISIVLGFGIANLLTGFARLVRRRGETRVYWPMAVQMAVLFLIHVQTWWAMFGLREGVRWTFAGFSTVLLQPVVLFLMSALIVPDDLQEQNAELRMQYFRESRWYFGSMIAVVCVSLARNLVLYGNVPALPNLIAHGLFFTVGVAGLASRKDLVHKVIAVFSFALYISYIAILFSDLS